jgi:hypothetical protein
MSYRRISARFPPGAPGSAGRGLSGDDSGERRAFPAGNPDSLAEARRRGGMQGLSVSGVFPCPRVSVRGSVFPNQNPCSLTGTRRHGEDEEHCSSVFLRVSAPPREHPGLPNRNHDSLAETRRRGGMQGLSASGVFPCPRVSVSPCLRERIGLFPTRTPVLSRGHGDTGRTKNIVHRFFSASPRLREKMGSFPVGRPGAGRQGLGGTQCMTFSTTSPSRCASAVNCPA